MNDQHTLKLLREVWADVSDPAFIWQLAALLIALGLAALVARAWERDALTRRAALHAAGSRLAFPLAAVGLLTAASLALRPFIHINLLKVAVALLASMALVRGIIHVLRRTFKSATWLAAWERALAFIVWGWLALYITGLAPAVVEALQQVSFAVGKQRLDLWMILHGVLTVFLTVLLALWAGGLLESRLMGMAGLDTSLRIVAVRVATALLAVVAVLASLSLVGIDMTALSVFTGALGVGLGFGLQKIASNYIAGFIILLDRSLRIGDMVQVDANTGGIVHQITTRYTVLRSLGGIKYIVPNETLVATIVQNQSYADSRVAASTTVGVAYSTDLDQAMGLMKDAAAAHPRVLADPAPGASLVHFGENAIELELGFWINDPEKGVGGVKNDINLALWRTFKKNAIAIAVPRREVRLVDERGGE